MGPKKIECYFDCISLYSYFAFLHLDKNASQLAALGVEIDIIPISLGRVMKKSGNQPPWVLPGRRAQGALDNRRLQSLHGKNFEVPKEFPIDTTLAQSALIHIRAKHPERYHRAFLSFFVSLWETHLNLSQPASLLSALTSSSLFTASEAESILSAAQTPELKAQLLANTEHVVKDLGAYGAPWFWVTNGEGKTEPFFGQDRWVVMYEFLGLPYSDVKLEAPTANL